MKKEMKADKTSILLLTGKKRENKKKMNAMKQLAFSNIRGVPVLLLNLFCFLLLTSEENSDGETKTLLKKSKLNF